MFTPQQLEIHRLKKRLNFANKRNRELEATIAQWENVELKVSYDARIRVHEIPKRINPLSLLDVVHIETLESDFFGIELTEEQYNKLMAEEDDQPR